MFKRATYRPADCLLILHSEDCEYEVQDLTTEADARAYVEMLDPNLPVEVESATVFGLLKSIGSFGN